MSGHLVLVDTSPRGGGGAQRLTASRRIRSVTGEARCPSAARVRAVFEHLFDRMLLVTLTDRAALLVLIREATGGWLAVADEVEEEGGALRVLERASAGQQSLFGDGGDWTPRVEAAEHEIAQWESEGYRFLTLLDKDFPAQLLT